LSSTSDGAHPATRVQRQDGEVAAGRDQTLDVHVGSEFDGAQRRRGGR
jgi:hypothetical protein